MAIVVGTDLSDHSVGAVRTAARLARRRSTALEILYCVEWADPDAFWRNLVETPWEQPDQLRAKARTKLESFVDTHLPGPQRPESHDLRVVLKKPTISLTAESGRDEVDLLVVGATGHGQVGSWVIGSTADYVVRGSDCPVLTIPDERALNDVDTVLAPVDLSECSRMSLGLADRWSRDYEASLHILRALPIPAAGLVPADIEIPTGNPDQHRRRGLEQLQSFVDDSGLSTPEPTLDVILEAPFVAIGEAADDLDADLTVMGTQGRRGLARFLLGSTTSKVLRHLERPLLTIRPDTT